MKLYISKGYWITSTILIGLISLALSIIIPPFMSPDEVDHVKRAYWLSEGNFLLDTPPGQSSGGLVDSGLLDYMNGYYLTFMKDRQHKVTTEDLQNADSKRWSGISEFTPAPGTGYYFPAIYLPQAMALTLGKHLNLSIDTSYKLARLLALLTSIALLLFALSIYETSPLALALLALPMTIFQFSSASLDGISNSLAVLAISLFMRIAQDGPQTKKWIPSILSLSLFLLISSRVHLLPMLALPFIAFFYTKHKSTIWGATLSTLATITWLAIAIKYTVDTRVTTGAPTGDIILYYIQHPLSFFQVVIATISKPEIQGFYYQSFIGNLGWLDTPFTSATYILLSAILLGVAISTIKPSTLKEQRISRLLLTICATCSVLLVFFALLITYNPHPATFIQGVQGRYFLVPMLMLAYAISGVHRGQTNFRRAIGFFFLIIFICTSGGETLKLLVSKYYITTTQTQGQGQGTQLRPSTKLTKTSPLVLKISESVLREHRPVKRLKVLLATWATGHDGDATFHFQSTDGKIITKNFELSSVKDNRYYEFDIKNLPYASSQILSDGGEGISLWNKVAPNGQVESCVIFEYDDGERTTDGCPPP